MNKYRSLILLIILTGLTPVVVQALSYTFVSADFLRFTSDVYGEVENIDGYGLSVDMSVAVRPQFALYAKGFRVNNAEIIVSGAKSSVDISSYSLGVLAHLPINEVSDLILKVGFTSGTASVDGVFNGSEDADGGEAMLGFRTMQSDKWELSAFINKNTIETKTNIGFSLGAAYYESESVSVDLGLSFDSDTSSLALGVTKRF